MLYERSPLVEVDQIHWIIELHHQRAVSTEELPGRAATDREIEVRSIVQMAVFKKAEDANDMIVRVFNPTDRRRTTTLSIEATGTKAPVKLEPLEIKTLRVNGRTGRAREVDLLER